MDYASFLECACELRGAARICLCGGKARNEMHELVDALMAAHDECISVYEDSAEECTDCIEAGTRCTRCRQSAIEKAMAGYRVAESKLGDALWDYTSEPHFETLNEMLADAYDAHERELEELKPDADGDCESEKLEPAQ